MLTNGIREQLLELPDHVAIIVHDKNIKNCGLVVQSPTPFSKRASKDAPDSFPSSL